MPIRAAAATKQLEADGSTPCFLAMATSESQYDTQAKNRKMAASALTQCNGEKSGPESRYAHVLASKPAREDSLGRWRVKYPKMLANTRNFDQVLAGIEICLIPQNSFPIEQTRNELDRMHA